MVAWSYVCHLLVILDGAVVDLNILARHALGVESFFEYTPTGKTINFLYTFHGAYGGIDVVHDESGHAVVDNLGHRAEPPRNHRRPAGHCFDHHEPERFLPVNREQESERPSKEIVLCPTTNLTNHLNKGM